jgi:hypothetical protein
MQEQERIRQQEQLRLEKEERERQERDRLENAAALDSIGETAAANRLLNEPPPPPPPVILPRSTPKVPGIAMTTRYSARVVDMKALLGAILAGKAPMMAVSANMVFLNQQARSMKETLQYPGVVVDKDNGISARRS